MKYRKKPVIVEAVQYTGSNFTELKDFGMLFTSDYHVCGTPIKIHTLEGDMICSVGDYVIRGVNGELYPCKQDIFDKTYEAVME